jgi:hypothetical protein
MPPTLKGVTILTLKKDRPKRARVDASQMGMASDPVNTSCFTGTPWLWLPRIWDKFLLKLQAKASSGQLAQLESRDTWLEIDQPQSYSYPQLIFCYD